MSYAITYADVLAAQGRLDGHARHTPLLHSPQIDYLCGARIMFKAECLQKVGAFKYRGAFNRLSVMSAAERAKGVVAFSSGNHAQGVSRAAKELGMSAIIVMPTDAPKVKVDGVRADGAEIVFYDRFTESREDIAAQISARDGRTLVPSYDDPYIMAGQGTSGLEILAQCRDAGYEPDAVITPIGGGGLCAGIGTVLAKDAPNTRLFAAEPEFYDDHRRSLKAGSRQGVSGKAKSLCDALMTPMPGELTFPINQKNLSGVSAVNDRDCLLAMWLLKRVFDVTVEPGGAAAFAAVLKGDLAGHNFGTVVVMLSGGNVDPDILDRAMDMFGD